MAVPGPNPARHRRAVGPAPRRAVPDLRRARVRGHHGERDAFDRLICRTKEMYESVKLIEQCLDSMPGGPVMADDRKHVLPPRHELHTSMESLIHHFKLVTEGFRAPPTRSTTPLECDAASSAATWCPTAARSRGDSRFRAPSFVSLQSTAMMAVNRYIADLIVVVGSLDGVMGEAEDRKRSSRRHLARSGGCSSHCGVLGRRRAHCHRPSLLYLARFSHATSKPAPPGGALVGRYN